jgi:hypothetical protein
MIFKLAVNLGALLNRQQALFLAPLPRIDNSNPRAIYLSFLLTLIFIIAYALVFLFVSLKAGEELDTKCSRSSLHTHSNKMIATSRFAL